MSSQSHDEQHKNQNRQQGNSSFESVVKCPYFLH